MLKTFLMATSVLVAAPVLAQETPTQDSSQPKQQMPDSTDDAAPGTQGAASPNTAAPTALAPPKANPAPATRTAQPTPSQPAPAETMSNPTPTTPTTPEATRPNATTTNAAGTATGNAAGAPANQPMATSSNPAAQPAATQGQVARAVSRDFGIYDKDGDGALNATEFNSWMSVLRKSAEPAFVAGSPEANTWLGQAFAAADVDKNQSVNAAELTSFLTPKPA